LYQSIHGGCDWDTVLRPLLEINVTLGLMFVFYIAFVLLAMMNVITGIFVDSAIKQADSMKDKDFKAYMRTAFGMHSFDDDGVEIPQDEFVELMQDKATVKQMRDLGIETNDAASLFEFLDGDGSGAVDAEELVTGLVRLRAGARFIDIMAMMHEIESWSAASGRLELQMKAMNSEATGTRRTSMDKAPCERRYSAFGPAGSNDLDGPVAFGGNRRLSNQDCVTSLKRRTLLGEGVNSSRPTDAASQDQMYAVEV
jgi:Ca2+-binding EF-hand superfamily protein